MAASAGPDLQVTWSVVWVDLKSAFFFKYQGGIFCKPQIYLVFPFYSTKVISVHKNKDDDSSLGFNFEHFPVSCLIKENGK